MVDNKQIKLLGQRVNRFEVTARGSADRTVYQNSHFTDGTTGSNADRDYNRYLAELKTSYELTPGMRAFVESTIDTRVSPAHSSASRASGSVSSPLTR